MDEQIIDFLSVLEDAVKQAEVVREFLVGGEIEASTNDLETAYATLEEQITVLQELQDVFNEEIHGTPDDMWDVDDEE